MSVSVVVCSSGVSFDDDVVFSSSWFLNAVGGRVTVCASRMIAATQMRNSAPSTRRMMLDQSFVFCGYVVCFVCGCVDSCVCVVFGISVSGDVAGGVCEEIWVRRREMNASLTVSVF